MGRRGSFLEYVVEQGFHLELVVLLVPATVYLALLAVVCALVRRWVDPRTLRAVFTSSLAGVVLAVVGITVFEALASWHRPYGDGVTVRMPDYRDRVEVAFLVLYPTLVLAGGLGWALGRARAPRSWPVALGTGVGLAGFLALTLPFVEFLNACHTGGPILIDRYIEC
jgi:xanthine/uracil permease